MARINTRAFCLIMVRTILGSLLLLSALFLLAAPDAQADEGEQPDPRFGVVSAFWLPEEAAALDVGWERILFYWSQIQPEGPEDWNTLHVMEEWLVEAEAQNREVVGLLKNTPPWATDGVPYGGVPRGLYLSHDDADNLWANYVRRIAEYYGPRGVHRWIIWNEPDIDQGVYGSEWAGSVEDYYRLVKVAYLVLQETDPEATVHLAGLTFWHDVVNGREQYLRRFLRVATADPEAAEYDFFFDVISLHIYFRSETVGDIVRQIDAIQKEFGLDKPIWINETNAAPTQDPLWPVTRPQFQLDLAQQASYIVQAHALGFAAGAERIGVYKFFDVGLAAGEESFGLIRADGSLRPAYDALQTTVRVLRDFSSVESRRSTAYYKVTFEQPWGTTDVLWARRPLTVTVPVTATLPQATLIDAYGKEMSVQPSNGVYSVTLAAARCDGECLVGGAPLFLVQRQPPPTATATATAMPSLTPSPTATATPSITPSPTATIMPSLTPSPTASPDAAAATSMSQAAEAGGGQGGRGAATSLSEVVAAPLVWIVGLAILSLVAVAAIRAGKRSEG